MVADNLEAVTAVANNSVKPSEAGKYPLKEEERKKSGRPKVCIPLVNAEVVRTAQERHRQGTMSPALYNLLTTGEILLPALLEDEGTELPNIHLVYRDLRRKVYGILFNLHHANYSRHKHQEELETAKRKVEEVAKRLSLVKPDSVIMKNSQPRSEREVLNEKLEAAAGKIFLSSPL